MQVRYDEGVAIHIDPEPCAVACEGDSEASAEEHIGQPWSPAKIHIPGADAVAKAEGDTDGRVKRERLEDPAWSKNLACVEARCAGTGRSHARPVERKRSGLHREGEEP